MLVKFMALARKICNKQKVKSSCLAAAAAAVVVCSLHKKASLKLAGELQLERDLFVYCISGLLCIIKKTF